MLNNPTPSLVRPQLPLPELGAAIEAMIALYDAALGDPDLENATDAEDEGLQPHFLDLDRGGPGCLISDPDGPASPEWHTLGRHKLPTRTRSLPDEDAELDDQPEDDDPDSCSAHEDQGSATGDDDGQPGDAGDAESTNDDECEQLGNDVPVLPVYAIEPNIFTNERECLGMNNLQPSFVGGSKWKAVD